MFWKNPDDDRDALRRFLLPDFSKYFWMRLGCLALVTILVVRFLVTPAFTDGASMVPTYRERQFLPIWRGAFWFQKPQLGDVVVVRYIGQRVMFLKRVVALEGQTVEFRQGRLFVDGVESDHPWNALTPCDWELPPRVVPKGELYLVGDNRSMPMEEHIFGHVSARRIAGAPLW